MTVDLPSPQQVIVDNATIRHQPYPATHRLRLQMGDSRAHTPVGINLYKYIESFYHSHSKVKNKMTFVLKEFYCAIVHMYYQFVSVCFVQGVPLYMYITSLSVCFVQGVLDVVQEDHQVPCTPVLAEDKQLGKTQ